MYLLDTNVISELRKRRPHGGVLAWIEGVPNEDLHLSALTLGELQAGVELTRQQDVLKAAEIEAWVDELATTWNVLPMDSATFRVWAKLMARSSDELIEHAMIAATALVNHLTIATRNIRDFRDFGVATLNPFERERR